MLAGLLLAMVSGASAALPAVDYVLHCQGCHLADGSETRGRVPALAGSVGRFLWLPEGRAYLVRVPGVAQAPLGDAELAALLDWMIARFAAGSAPPDFAPYTAGEVARWRRAPLTDLAEARRRILEAAERAGAPR